MAVPRSGVVKLGDLSTTTAASRTLTFDASWQVGDVLTVILYMGAGNTVTFNAAPAGWVQVGSTDYNGTVLATAVFQHVMAAGESSSTTAVFGISAARMLLGFAFAMPNSVSPYMDAGSPVFGQQTAASVNAIAPAYTTTTGGVSVVSAMASRYTTTTGVKNVTLPGSHTPMALVQFNPTAAASISAVLGYVTTQPGPAGTYGSYTATADATPTNNSGVELVFFDASQPDTFQQPLPRRRSWLPARWRRSTAQIVPASTVVAPAFPPQTVRDRLFTFPRPLRRQRDRIESIGTPLFVGDAASFQTGTGGYTAGTGAPTVSQSTTQAFTGTGSLKFVSTATGTAAVNSPAVQAIGPGYIIRVHAWIFCETNARTVSLQVAWLSASGAFLAGTGLNVAGVLGQWVQVSGTVTAPSIAGLTGIRIVPFAQSTAVSDVFYVDDVDARIVGFTAPQFTPAQWTQHNQRRNPPVRGRRASSTVVFPQQAAAPTTQALPPQQPTAVRRGWLARRRPFNAAPVRAGTQAPTTQALPPQGAVRRPLWFGHRRAFTTTAPAMPVVGVPQPRARHAAPPVLRRARTTLPPQTLPGVPPQTRARHAAPPVLRRRRITETPPAAPAVITQALPPQGLRARVLGWLPRSRRRATLVLPQAAATVIRDVDVLTGELDGWVITQAGNGWTFTPLPTGWQMNSEAP